MKKEREREEQEILEFIINRVSYLTIKPEYDGEWAGLCVHAKGGVHCKICQQEQCDAAGGGMPEPSKYKWKVVRRRKGE